jgi:4-hydroxybenzoate polyprenyltransferase
LYLDLIRWDRPAGWLLLLWPTLAALWIAADGFPGWHLLLVFVAGTVLMRSAGCCINDVADREFDRHVKRTAQRPVTSGLVGVAEALLVGAVLALLAFALVLTTNPPTILLSFAGLAMPSACWPCHRQCSAWLSASASRWPLPPRKAAAIGRWPRSAPRCRRWPGG